MSESNQGDRLTRCSNQEWSKQHSQKRNRKKNQKLQSCSDPNQEADSRQKDHQYGSYNRSATGPKRMTYAELKNKLPHCRYILYIISYSFLGG
ncbi:hypothetical protein LSH36_683g03117, partial [Paralvinella palmiformis]